MEGVVSEWKHGFINVSSLAHNIHELIVHKAQSAAPNEVPLMKDVVAPPPAYYSKIVRHEDKPIVPSK